MSTRTLIKNVILEDILHWWILFTMLNVFSLDYYIQGIIQSILFAVGHLGIPLSPTFKRMARDKKFWFIKFPFMFVFGWLYFYIVVLYGRITVTCIHITYDRIIIYFMRTYAPVELSPIQQFEAMAKYYKENPMVVPTSESLEDIERKENFKKELAALVGAMNVGD